VTLLRQEISVWSSDPFQPPVAFFTQREFALGAISLPLFPLFRSEFAPGLGSIRCFQTAADFLAGGFESRIVDAVR